MIRFWILVLENSYESRGAIQSQYVKSYAYLEILNLTLRAQHYSLKFTNTILIASSHLATINLNDRSPKNEMTQTCILFRFTRKRKRQNDKLTTTRIEIRKLKMEKWFEIMIAKSKNISLDVEIICVKIIISVQIKNWCIMLHTN